MSFGVMAWLVRHREHATFNGLERTAFWAYVAGSLGFILVLLTAGAMSVPRRWAMHAPEWIAQDRISTLFGLIILLGATYFVTRYAIRLLTSQDVR